MEYQSFKNAVIDAAKRQGLSEYELYYRYAETSEVGIYQMQVNSVTNNTEGGVCFRCIVNGKMGYASTEDLSLENAEALVQKAMDNASVLEAEEKEYLGKAEQSYQTITEDTTPKVSLTELTEEALALQKSLYAASEAVIDGSETTLTQETGGVCIYNSNGLDLKGESTVKAAVVGVVVEQNEEKANEYEIRFAKNGKIDHEEMAKKAVEEALSKLGGEVAPTGVWPIVFSPKAMSSLLSTFAGIFSSENTQKGLSKLAGKEGERIAAEGVTIIDDPFCSENPHRSSFDAEGSPTFTKKLVENGTLKTLLYDLKTAAKEGKKTTGNGKKAGYYSEISVAPYTLYIAPSSQSETQLLEKAGNGIYINSLGGLHAGANPISGDFSLQSAGFMIENGKKTTPVRSFTVAGNFFDLLMKITDTADDLSFPGGAAAGSPSVLVSELSVAGKA